MAGWDDIPDIQPSDSYPIRRTVATTMAEPEITGWDAIPDAGQKPSPFPSPPQFYEDPFATVGTAGQVAGLTGEVLDVPFKPLHWARDAVTGVLKKVPILNKPFQPGAAEAGVAPDIIPRGQVDRYPSPADLETQGGTTLAEIIPQVAEFAAYPPYTRGLGAIAGMVLPSVSRPVDKRLTTIIKEGLQKGIRPGVAKQRTAAQAERYYKKGQSAVESIIENKPNLSLTEPTGEAVQGTLPKSLNQFSEAIGQTKKRLFTEYNALTETAGETGATVTHDTALPELGKIATSKPMRLASPDTAKYAEEQLVSLAEAGPMSLGNAQEAIEIYNSRLKAFYARPTYDAAGKASVDALIVNHLRRSLDNAISGLTGESYQELKNAYGALKEIEQDVSHRAAIHARGNVKGLIDFSDIFSGERAVTSLVTLDPVAFVQAATIKGISNYIRWMNNPDRHVARMFEKAEKLMAQRAASPSPARPSIIPPPTGARATSIYEPPPSGAGPEGMGMAPPTGAAELPIGPGGPLPPSGPARPVLGPPTPPGPSTLITPTVGGQAPRPAVSPGPEPNIGPPEWQAPQIVTRTGIAPPSTKVGAPLATPKSAEGVTAGAIPRLTIRPEPRREFPKRTPPKPPPGELGPWTPPDEGGPPPGGGGATEKPEKFFTLVDQEGNPFELSEELARASAAAVASELKSEVQMYAQTGKVAGEKLNGAKFLERFAQTGKFHGPRFGGLPAMKAYAKRMKDHADWLIAEAQKEGVELYTMFPGSISGLERDENGEPTFNLGKAVAGMVAAGAGAKLVNKMVKAYHGSPTKGIKAFSNEKIGTGQGAQSFGWGHYMTEAPTIAEHYAKEGSYFPALRKWGTDKGISDNAIIELSRLEREYGFKNGAPEAKYFARQYLEKAKKDLKVVPTNEMKQFVETQREVLDVLENKLGELPQKEGKVYPVTIHAGKQPSEYTFLEWEKNLSPDVALAVKERAAKEGIPLQDLLVRRGYNLEDAQGLGYAMGHGQGLYLTLQAKLGSPQAASEFLSRAGISGIKYPAGTLSGVKSDAYNYVVFNPEHITMGHVPEGAGKVKPKLRK